MRTRRLAFSAVVAILLIATSMAGRPLHAADEGVFRLRGAGSWTCAQYLEVVKNQDERGLYLAGGWIDGYVTALNDRVDGVFEMFPWQSTELVMELVHNHCERVPEEMFFAAVSRLVVVTKPTRLAKKSDIVQIPVPEGNPIQLYKPSLALAQEQLKALGHYTSTVDGAFGPGTAAAFRAFQAEAGLPETGLPDQITLWTLFAPLYEEAG